MTKSIFKNLCLLLYVHWSKSVKTGRSVRLKEKTLTVKEFQAFESIFHWSVIFKAVLTNTESPKLSFSNVDLIYTAGLDLP